MSAFKEHSCSSHWWPFFSEQSSDRLTVKRWWDVLLEVQSIGQQLWSWLTKICVSSAGSSFKRHRSWHTWNPMWRSLYDMIRYYPRGVIVAYNLRLFCTRRWIMWATSMKCASRKWDWARTVSRIRPCDAGRKTWFVPSQLSSPEPWIGCCLKWSSSWVTLWAGWGCSRWECPV